MRKRRRNQKCSREEKLVSGKLKVSRSRERDSVSAAKKSIPNKIRLKFQ